MGKRRILRKGVTEKKQEARGEEEARRQWEVGPESGWGQKKRGIPGGGWQSGLQ